MDITNTSIDINSDLAPECVVIGAGPAGLTAATYLARFHRRTVVYDAGSSRASLISASHNYPGTSRHGVSGKKLLSQLRHQAQRFGARIVKDRIVDIRSRENVNGTPEFIVTSALGTCFNTQRLLIATGMDDVLPATLQSHAAIRNGIVRLCSICDGYETEGKYVAVLGAGNTALTHALFLRTFCRDVTAVLIGDGMDESFKTLLKKAKIAALPIIRADVDAIKISGDNIIVSDDSKRTHRFDCIYPAMGSHYRVDVVRNLAVACTDEGAIKTDEHCRTSVSGVFAAGDVTPTVKQICVAIAQGAVAAIAMHNSMS